MLSKKNAKVSVRVYLDYAAATPLDSEVARVMRSFEDTHFANAFSIHEAGRESKRVLEESRRGVAEHLGVRAEECFFTSGATDALMRAIHGATDAVIERGGTYTDMHIVMSAVEHSSVKSCVEALGRRGVSISIVPVSHEGIVDIPSLGRVLRANTVLVFAMLVNNEIGTIQPIQKIARVIHDHYAKSSDRPKVFGNTEPIFLVDASQAPLSLRIAPHDLGVSMLILDAHKIYGPKRTGFLYVRSGTTFTSPCDMFGMVPREGTPDVGGAIGMRTAYDSVEARREGDTKKWRDLKTYFIEALMARFPGMIVNGSIKESVPNILNVSFPDVNGEFLATKLDMAGVAAAVKSACLSGGKEGSYVIHALAPERANESIRFSFGRETSRDDVDYTISVLADILV
ncbi:MAG: cysteine desulfurase family protein [Patescibacteria group bacterium]